MKKLLLLLLLPFSLQAASPIGGPISGGRPGLSSNQVYEIAVAVANAVGGATNGIPKLDGFGTNTTFDGITINYGDGIGLTNVPAAGVTGLPAALAAATNHLVRVWNIRDYGAVGNNLAADSVGLANAASNAFRFGGVVYMPRSSPNAAYIFTNSLSIPNISTNGTETRYSDITFAGDGIGATQVKLAITNGVWLSCVGNAPALRDFSVTYAGSGTNTVLENANAAYGTIIERVGAYNFTNSEAFRISALMGTRILSTDFEHGAVGIRLLRYMDGTEIDTRGSYMTIAPVVIGGYNPTYPELANATGVRVKLNGTVNTYGVIVAGGSRGAEISGYQERPARGAVCLGYPLDLFPGETNNTIAQVSIKNLYCPVNYSNSAPFISVETTVQDLHMNGVFGGDLVVVTNQTWANALRIHLANHQCANSEVRWPTANINIPSSPYSDQNINRSYKQWSYSSGTTNLVISLDTTGARVNGQIGINSDATLAPLTVKLSSLSESWLQVMANVGTASAAKTMRFGMHAYDGGTEVQTIMFGNIPSSGAATLNIGGGTSVGNPFSVLDFYVGGNPAIAYSGTNMMRINTTGVLIQSGAQIFHSLAASNHITGPTTYESTLSAIGFKGLLASGDVTNAAGSRVAYLTDVAGGSGSNGISYAEISWPAFGTTGNEEAWLKYTNGVKAITAINDAGSSRLVFTNYDGTYIANFDNTGFIALNITETDGTPVLSQANNVRTLADGNGDVAIDFASKTAVTIDGFLLNTPGWDVGEFLWIDGSGQVSGTSNLPLASLTVTGNAVVEGQVIGNGQGITNLIYVPNTVTLFETNAAILTNCVSFLTVTNHVRFTNWASVAVAGQWFNVFLTNSTGNNYYIDVPTNGFTRNMTNSTGSHVVADASGTNYACLLTNGQRARLVGEFVGGNLNAATFYFRHW